MTCCGLAGYDPGSKDERQNLAVAPFFQSMKGEPPIAWEEPDDNEEEPVPISGTGIY